MERHLRTQIGRLSGGQRRRVFLARALAAEPDLFLLDEPVTGIDATTQELLMDLLEAQAQRGKTVVATTHDLALRGAAVPAGAGRQPDGRRLRARRTSSSTPTSSPPPTAATCWCSRAGPSSSTTPTTTTTRRPASATSTSGTGAADGPDPRAAALGFFDPRPRRVGDGRARVRGRRHVRRAARDRVHRRRHRPRRRSRASWPRTCSGSRSTSAPRWRRSARRSRSAT